MMSHAMANTVIAVLLIFAIGCGWIVHIQNRGRRRTRAASGGDGGGDNSYSSTSDGFSLGNWFSGDSTGSGCSTSDSGSSGGDCGGGGGDGGGGGGGGD